MEATLAPEARPDNAVVWHDARLYLLDQRRLPAEAGFVVLDEAKATAAAIRDMVVRGAPAIGITAAYGAVLSARRRYRDAGAAWREGFAEDLQALSRSRPTAVNLAWAVARMGRCAATLGAGDPEPALLAEALAIHRADVAANRRIGELGAELISEPTAVITHCNAGALATGGYGTALGVIRSAHATGRIEQVFAGETRPWLQGSRLTAWELLQNGIPVTLLADGAAASLLATGRVGWVIVGSDRIAANGDVANKIGTYGLALAARYHGVRFMVAAPTSTVDLSVPDGGSIPIESREPAEILECAGTPVAAAGAGAWNPVFDMTPAGLVDAIVTEKGVVLKPDAKKMVRMMEK